MNHTDEEKVQEVKDALNGGFSRISNSQNQARYQCMTCGKHWLAAKVNTYRTITCYCGTSAEIFE